MRFGVIGCGMISQIQHIPNIWELTDSEIIAVCDIRYELAKRIASKYQIPYAYFRHKELLARDDIDTVLIAVPPEVNVEVATDTLNAGKHLFLEKPMALTVSGAEQIVNAAKDNDVVLQIGYNRRHDATYDAAIRKIDEMESAFLARAVNYNHRPYIDEIYHVLRMPSQDQLADTRELREKQLVEQLGKATMIERRAYTGLVESTIHIFNAMRGIFGDPQAIIKTEIWTLPIMWRETTWEFPIVYSILDYGKTMRVVVEQGLNRTKRMIEFIEVWSPLVMVRLSYDDPYLQNSLTTLEIFRSDNAERDINTIVGSRKTSFQIELSHFIDCIENKKTPKTPGEDGLKDIRILAAVMESYIKDTRIDLSL